jgi:hypothetical protein
MAMFDMVAYPKFGLPIHSLVFELLLQKNIIIFWGYVRDLPHCIFLLHV